MLYLLLIGVVVQQSLANSSGDFEDVNRKVTVLIKQFSVLNDELSMVKQKLAMQYDENQTMKQIIILVTEGNIELKERVDKLSNENRMVNNIVKQLLEERDATNCSTSENNDVSNHFSKQKRLLLSSNTPTTTVAFSVSLTHNIQLGQYQVVEYDKVNTNIGNAYDIRHAHFIVPTRGVYLLSFTAMNLKVEHLYLEMVKNSEKIAIVYVGQNYYNMGSETIVHLLEKGDVVWVRHDNSGTPTLYGGDAFNTFTGALLFEM